MKRYDILAVIIGLTIAVGLFLFGLEYPQDARLTGDAKQYFQIASQFDNFYAAITYVGERSSGMPIFDWIFRPSNYKDLAAVPHWVLSICLALFIIHILASFIGVSIAKYYSPIQSRNGLRFLFIFLVSFPALVGHTTTPLTDTLSVDLALIFLASLLWTLKARGFLSYTLPILSGIIGAYACLLRTALLIPTLVALGILVVLSVAQHKTKILMVLLVFAGILIAESERCQKVYGQRGLQDPKTFDAIGSAQMGLLGGRLMWSGPEIPNRELPIVPDQILKDAYFDRCKLESIVGLKDTSLLGCLLARPLLIPVYLTKKWVGLFDHFRFQPYVETETPSWLVVMSRTYDIFAWIGFWASLVGLIYLICGYRTKWKPEPVIIAHLVFVFLMLGEHTILHPEDRYGLVLMPTAGVSFVVFMERFLQKLKAKNWSQLLVPTMIIIFSVGVFLWQVIKWDHTPFH